MLNMIQEKPFVEQGQEMLDQTTMALGGRQRSPVRHDERDFRQGRAQIRPGFIHGLEPFDRAYDFARFHVRLVLFAFLVFGARRLFDETRTNDRCRSF